MLVWEVEELFSTGLPGQIQPVSNLVVSAKIALSWLEATAWTSGQEMTMPTPKQLSNVKFNNSLDLFITSCKVLNISKAIKRIWAKQRFMP